MTLSLESCVGAVLRLGPTAKVPLSPREPDVVPRKLCRSCAEVRPPQPSPREPDVVPRKLCGGCAEVRPHRQSHVGSP
ncbi:unnamed protein product [Staurois parvus]|uniref:Uncharacterized protein n=1 Tax=Staurois parvus TaxID=386267 RepID=A0ABN9CHK7_9NEOB|nr:unnamed protein product [Staurois parvus]